jgi:drug/metabolite transporter (DMT)-like permease
MLFFFTAFSVPNGWSFFKCKEPILLAYRTVFATVGFWTYSLARVWTSTIDNSLLYSTDAIWILLILYLLGIRVRRFGRLGIFLGFIGIIVVYTAEFRSFHDLIGAVFGTIAGLTLAIITVISSYLVKQDPPIRIGFYQSLAGLLSSLIIALLAGAFQNSSFPNYTQLSNMFFAGTIIAAALFCLWQALYYTESYIVGAGSYFFPVFVVSLSWIINGDTLDLWTATGISIIAAGTLLVIIDAIDKRHNKDRIYADSRRTKKK